MTANNSQFHRCSPLFQTHKAIVSSGLKLTSLIRSIPRLITLAGLVLASSGARAEALINPNEMWLNPGILHKICVHDIDQDGDLDVFKFFPRAVTMLENIGTPESPEFAHPQPFANDRQLKKLGLSDCRSFQYPGGRWRSPYTFVSIDIDADGDLDKFTGSDLTNLGSQIWNAYHRNNGTTEYPLYVEETFDNLIPENSINFMLKEAPINIATFLYK